jgi:hypothetical protein
VGGTAASFGKFIIAFLSLSFPLNGFKDGNGD